MATSIAGDLRINIGGDSTGAEAALQRTRKSAGELDSAFSGLNSTLGQFASAAAMGAVIKSSIDSALAVEKFTAAMGAVSSNSILAAREIQFIREESNRLGLSFVDTAGAFAKFTASTRNTVLEGEATRKIFIGVSEAVTALKLSGDESKGIFLALSQMMSKGKVSAEELNGQLGERLPGALKLTADAMGMTTGELMKQMEQGKLMSSDVLPKLAEQLHKTYGEAAKKSAEGGQASINRFNNEIKETAAAIGSKLMPAVSALGNKIASTLKTLRENPPSWISNWTFALGITPPDVAKTKPVSSTKNDLELAAEKSKVAAAAAKEKAEKDKAEAEKQKKELEKQKHEALTHFRETARDIINIEQEKNKKILELQKEAGAKAKENYKERLADLESFKKTMEEINANKTERDTKRAEEAAATRRGPEDDYQKYYRQLAENQQAMINLENQNPTSVDAINKKLKAMDALILKSEEQTKLALAAGVQNVSAETIAYNQRILREGLEAKILELETSQKAKLEESTAAAKTDSEAWQQRIQLTQDKISVLAQMLHNLPRIKEIDIKLKVTGMDQLRNIPGIMVSTTPVTLDSSGTNIGNAVGTSYVPRTGLYQLHRGESVSNRTETARNSQSSGNSVNLSGGINITIQGGSTSQQTADEIARAVWPRIQQYQKRYATA